MKNKKPFIWVNSVDCDKFRENHINTFDPTYLNSLIFLTDTHELVIKGDTFISDHSKDIEEIKSLIGDVESILKEING